MHARPRDIRGSSLSGSCPSRLSLGSVSTPLWFYILVPCLSRDLIFWYLWKIVYMHQFALWYYLNDIAVQCVRILFPIWRLPRSLQWSYLHNEGMTIKITLFLITYLGKLNHPVSHGWGVSRLSAHIMLCNSGPVTHAVMSRSVYTRFKLSHIIFIWKRIGSRKPIIPRHLKIYIFRWHFLTETRGQMIP